MKELSAWFARKAAEEGKRPFLDAALLTGQAWSYAAYRVRFLLLRAMLRAGLHAAEVLLFSSLFSMDFLAPIIVLRGATAIAGGLWWGGLESLRQQVRELSAKKSWSSVRATIDSWLLFSFLLASAIVLGGAAWVLSTPDRELGFSIFDTYALGCFLRLGCDLVSRTYHSGLFALRRIRRPLWSLLVIDVSDLLGVLLLWPMLGPWSFGIVLGAVGILRAALTFVFVGHSFRRSKIPRFRLGICLKQCHNLPVSQLPDAVSHGLANSAGHLDAILVMAFVVAAKNDERYLHLAIVFHLVRPFLSAGFGWARVFYFDFKKLEHRHGRFFMLRFQAFVRRFGMAFSLVLAAVSIAWAGLLWPGVFQPFWFLLFPFFLARSLVAIYQVQAFSYGQYRYLALQAAALASVIAGVLWLPLSPTSTLAMASLVLLGGSILVGPPDLPRPSWPALPHARAVSLPRWLDALDQQRNSVRVGALLVHSGLESAQRATRALASALPPAAAVTRFGHAQILWFEPGGSSKSLVEVVTAVAACARRIAVTDALDHGALAWEQARGSRLLEPALVELTNPAQTIPGCAADLSAEFTRRFPQGAIIDEDRRSLPRKRYPMTPVQVRRLLSDVFRKSIGLSPNRCSIPGIDLTVYCPRGEPELLFVIHSDEPAAERAQWRRLVDSATLLHSLSQEEK